MEERGPKAQTKKAESWAFIREQIIFIFKRVLILLYLPMFTSGVQLHSHIDRWKEYCSKNILFKKISIVSMPGDFVAVGYLQAQRGRRLHCHGRNSSGRSSSIKNNIALVVLVHESRTKMLFILYLVECLDNIGYVFFFCWFFYM